MLYESQRPIWAREKAENHAYYKEVLRVAALDATPGMWYGSNGQWSALAYAMSGDVAHAHRSYAAVLSTFGKGNFNTAPTFYGDSLREFGVEQVVQWTLIQDALAPADRDAYKGWLLRIADRVLVDGCRFGDSDQLTGTHFFMVLIDKTFGTDYGNMSMANPSGTGPQIVSDMRAQVRMFCEVLAEGGDWCESSDYNLNTLYVLYHGAECVGIDDYPEVKVFRDSNARSFIASFVPDLKNTFEWGDEQTPDYPPFQLVEDVLAYLGNTYPEAAAFEADVRAAMDEPFGTAFYARYFFWANPYAMQADWHPFVGLSHFSPGVGQLTARTGWTAEDAGLWSWCPSYNKGELDHGYYVFGDFRVWNRGVWTRDHPLGYSDDVRLANHVILKGMGSSVEVGLMTGTAVAPGQYAYTAGANGGSSVFPGFYDPPETFIHERARKVLWLMQRNVLVILDRIHVEDPTVLPKYGRYYAADKKKMDGAVLIDTLWHSNDEPEIVDGQIRAADLVRPLYPCTLEKVNQADIVYTGWPHDSERHWHTRVIADAGPGFHVLATVIGDVTATAELLGDLHRVRVTQAGHPDLVVYSSAVAGPKLVTSKNGTVSVHDPTKLDAIVQAQTIVNPPPELPDCDVFVLQPDGLEFVPASGTTPPEPPDILPAHWAITEQTRTRIVLELARYTRRPRR